LPRNNANPHCPACGSSATLPFENEENSRTEQTFPELILTVFLIFLVLFSLFLLLLLSRVGLPIGMVALLAVLLLWRRTKEKRQLRHSPQRFVCLDCSCNFNA
jgi:Flp pilus assembly protein TadB